MTKINCKLCKERMERNSSTHKYCNLCRKEVDRLFQKEYRNEHKQDSKEYHRKYYLKNKDYILLKANKYYEKNRERLGYKKREDIWTQKEMDFLKKNYGKIKITEMQKGILYKRSKSSIMTRANDYNLKSNLTEIMLKNKSIAMKKQWKNPNSKLNSEKTKRKISLAEKRLWKNSKYRENQSQKIMEGLQIKPNKPEKTMIKLIKENNLPFNYTGDGKVILNGFNPDFLSKNPKHIIEVNGDYFHNLPKNKEKDKRKIKAYASLGYKTLTIWEHELKNPNKVLEKVREFIKK